MQRDKKDLIQQKDDHILTLNQDINSLEQQLIQAKLDAAQIKSQLQEEKNRALILKRQIKDTNKVEQIQLASKGTMIKLPSTIDFMKPRKESPGKRQTSFVEIEEKKVGNQEYADHLIEHQEQWRVSKQEESKMEFGES